MHPTDYARLLEIKAYMSKFRTELAGMQVRSAIASDYIEAAQADLTSGVMCIGKVAEVVKGLEMV